MTEEHTVIMPDFDEWYVADRSPESIERARNAWCELETLRLKVNEVQGLVKNNRHSLATSQNVKKLNQVCRKQSELKERLTEMQRQLSYSKIQFQACGVVKLSHMERAFLQEAERYLPAVAFHEIKRRAVERIRRQMDAAKQVRRPEKTRIGDLPDMQELNEARAKLKGVA